MVARIRRRLVIDTNVVRAAGGKAASLPTSKQCRDFLDAVLTICHGMALSEELYAEWRRHQSRFACNWRRSMLGHRKFAYMRDASNDRLRDAVASLPLTEKEREVILKDVHLVEAAMASDRVVVSCDKAARSTFRKAAGHIPALREIMWVNPTEDHDNVLRWLSEGAERRHEFLLGC